MRSADKARGLVDTTEERQTLLTSKFTDAERKALRQLEHDLTSIFEEAFPQDEKASLRPVIVWGVTIDPVKPDVRAQVVLMHFLRAKKLKVGATRASLIETLRWRKGFIPEKAAEEHFDEDVFGRMGNVYGKDREGRPVLYATFGRTQDPDGMYEDPETYVRWRIGLIERTLMQLDFETVDGMMGIVDFAGLQTDRPPSIKKIEAEVSKLIQTHYPGLGDRLFLVNFPYATLLRGILWMLRPFHPKGKKLKNVTVLGTGARVIGAGLLPFVDEYELPRPYGGVAEPEWCQGEGWEEKNVKATS